MSLGFLLLAALVVFLGTMGSRAPWTRIGGALWLVAASVAVTRPGLDGWSGLSNDAWAATLFVALAALTFWWSMHREQEPSGSPADDEGPPARGVLLRSAGVGVGLAVVALLAWARPPSLDDRSLDGTEPATPWFLAGLEEIARWTGSWTAWVLLPATALICLLAAPFLDTREPEIRARFRGRSDEVPFFFFAWLMLGVLPVAVAALLRPLGVLGTDASPSTPLSHRFWVDALGMPAPEPLLLRELPGILALVVLFVVLPWLLPRWKPTRGAFSRHRRRLGRRYIPAMVLVAAVVYIYLALLAGALFDVGPWLDPGISQSAGAVGPTP